MQTDWQMPRRADACRGCARVFEVGDAIRAFLYAIPSGFERRDFCPACTNNDPQALASWQTRRANPATPRSFAFDCEAVFAFFVRLTPQERGSPAGPLQSQDTGFALELRSAA